MGFFSKRVSDPDICFCRDFGEIVVRLNGYTTGVALSTVANAILQERGLLEIVQRHAEKIAGYNIQDCYNIDRAELLNRAEAIMELPYRISENDNNLRTRIMYNGLSILRRMNLLDSEKEIIIRKYLTNNDFLIKEYKGMF